MKNILWIFNHYDFSVKDVVEVNDYEINIDEETNKSSSIILTKKTTATANDIIALKKDGQIIYWGVIQEIQNENGKEYYTYICKYLTNLFDQKVALEQPVQTIVEGYYRIKSMIDSGNVISVKNDSTASGSTCVLWEKNSKRSQIWKLIQNGSYWKIQNYNSGQYLDVQDSQYTENGKAIVQTDVGCLWDIIEFSTGIFYLSPQNGSGYAIDIDDGTIANNSKIQLWENVSTNQDNRKFYFEKTNEPIIWEKGIEDFLAEQIKTNFIESEDTLLNKTYLDIQIGSHTTLDTSVDNENGIYNLHTFMTNCTQNYNIVFEISVSGTNLQIEIKNKSLQKELIDTKAMNIIDYEEVFETDIVAKVIVITSTIPYILYLKNDRTTTTDGTDVNRAKGKTTTVYCESYKEARQSALNEITSNKYNHNISFKFDKFIPVGTPIAIKTKNTLIYDTYISSIKITKSKMYEYTCGNIRINFIDKLLKGDK